MRDPEYAAFSVSDLLMRGRYLPGPASSFLSAVALGLSAGLLGGCSGTSDAQTVVTAVTDWHKAFVNGASDSCQSLTQPGQDDLQLVMGTSSCQEAAKSILKTFSTQDRDGFLNVSVDPGKVQIDGSRALVSAGAISYKPEVTEVLRLDGPVTLTRIDNQWRIDSVVNLQEH